MAKKKGNGKTRTDTAAYSAEAAASAAKAGCRVPTGERNGGGTNVPRERDMARQVALADLDRQIARRDLEADLAPFGEGLEFTPQTLAAVTAQIRFLARINAQAILKIGALLVWVQGHMDDPAVAADGNGFDAWLEGEGTFDRRTAYRYMAVARRLSGLAASARGRELPASKLYALLELPDAEIKELAEGRPVRGATLDELDRMSSVELRQLCRRQKERLAEGGQQLKAARVEIAQLRADLDIQSHDVNPRFAERSMRTLLEMGEFLARFEPCTEEAQLIEAAGCREAAQKVLVEIGSRAQRLLEVSRRITIPGTVVKIDPFSTFPSARSAGQPE